MTPPPRSWRPSQAQREGVKTRGEPPNGLVINRRCIVDNAGTAERPAARHSPNRRFMRRNDSRGTARPTTVVPSGGVACANSHAKFPFRALPLLSSTAVSIAAVLVGGLSGSAQASSHPAAPARLEIEFTSRAALDHALEHQSARIVRVLTPIHAAEVATADPRALADTVRGRRGITSVRPVVLRTSMTERTSSLSAKTW